MFGFTFQTKLDKALKELEASRESWRDKSKQLETEKTSNHNLRRDVSRLETSNRNLEFDLKQLQAKADIAKEKALQDQARAMQEALVKSDILRARAEAKVEIYEKLHSVSESQFARAIAGKLADAIGKAHATDTSK